MKEINCLVQKRERQSHFILFHEAVRISIWIGVTASLLIGINLIFWVA